MCLTSWSFLVLICMSRYYHEAVETTPPSLNDFPTSWVVSCRSQLISPGDWLFRLFCTSLSWSLLRASKNCPFLPAVSQHYFHFFQLISNSSNYGRTGPGDDHSARVLWIKSSQALTRQSYILLSSKTSPKIWISFSISFGRLENVSRAPCRSEPALPASFDQMKRMALM